MMADNKFKKSDQVGKKYEIFDHMSGRSLVILSDLWLFIFLCQFPPSFISWLSSSMTPAIQMQYYAAQNDITWASGYARPRMAFGPFNYILENHCKKHNFNLLEHIHYGKPQKKAFEFVQN